MSLVARPVLANPKWVWIPDDPVNQSNGNATYLVRHGDASPGQVIYNYHFHRYIWGVGELEVEDPGGK